MKYVLLPGLLLLTVTGAGARQLPADSTLTIQQQEAYTSTSFSLAQQYRYPETEEAATVQTHLSGYGKRSNRGARNRDFSWDEVLGTVSGIGADFYKPNMVSAATVKGNWVNINLLIYCIEFQAGFGTMRADASKLPDKDPYQTYIGDPNTDVYVRNWALGVNFPLLVKPLGFRNGHTRSALRGHPFLAGSFGAQTFWDHNRMNKSSNPYMALAPGYRLFNNYLSAEIRLQANIGFKDDDNYLVYTKPFNLVPVFTLRMNGVFDRLVAGQRSIGNTSVSYSNVRTNRTTSREYIGSQAYDRVTTTTYADVNVSRGVSVINDIGSYFGIGPRVSFTRPMVSYYAVQSLTGGLTANFRANKFLFGLNAETGRVGHASITGKNGEDKRKPDKDATYGRGSIWATNVFADMGLDISAFAKAMFTGIVDDDNSATPFASLNFGYSLGYSFMQDQKFDNPVAATAAYSQYFSNPANEPSKRNDPRLSQSGIVGGFFLGMDMGAVGFKLQWYRYRNAPLANNLYYTLSYRF